MPVPHGQWTGMTGTPVSVTSYVDSQGNPLGEKSMRIKPTSWRMSALACFFSYQLNHYNVLVAMFMWNFAGRQE